MFSNFHYFPLVWHFCSTASSQKIKKIQERALKLLYHDSYSTYNSLLLEMKRPKMDVSRLWRLAFEGRKTLNPSNPDFVYTCLKIGSHSATKKQLT